MGHLASTAKIALSGSLLLVGYGVIQLTRCCVSRQCVSLQPHPSYQDRATGRLSGAGMKSMPFSAKNLTGPPAPNLDTSTSD